MDFESVFDIDKLIAWNLEQASVRANDAKTWDVNDPYYTFYSSLSAMHMSTANALTMMLELKDKLQCKNADQ